MGFVFDSHGYVYIYIYRCTQVVNDARQSVTQCVIKSNLIHDISGINSSSGEINVFFHSRKGLHLKLHELSYF